MADARVGHELEHAGQHAEPGAKNGRHDDIDRDPAARRRAQRGFHLTIFGRHIAQRLGTEQHADAIGQRAKFFRIGLRVAQASETVVDEWVLDELQHGGLKLTSRRARGTRGARRQGKTRTIQRTIPVACPSPRAFDASRWHSASRRRASLRHHRLDRRQMRRCSSPMASSSPWTVSAGVLNPGSVVDRRHADCGGRSPGGHRCQVHRRRDHRCDRQGRTAGSDQHAHARGHGDVPGSRRRPRADGLAAEVHLPGRSEDGAPRNLCASARAWRRSR